MKYLSFNDTYDELLFLFNNLSSYYIFVGFSFLYLFLVFSLLFTFLIIYNYHVIFFIVHLVKWVVTFTIKVWLLVVLLLLFYPFNYLCTIYLFRFIFVGVWILGLYIQSSHYGDF